MTCEGYLFMLETNDPGQPPPEAFLAHAKICRRCAFALRVEAVLASAPAWAPRERMSAERRTEVLAKARVGILFCRSITDFISDSAVTALVMGVLVASAVWGLPPFLGKLLRTPALEAIAPAVHAVVQPVLGFASPFRPLLQSPVGMALGVGTTLLVFLAVAMSARLLSTDPGE